MSVQLLNVSPVSHLHMCICLQLLLHLCAFAREQMMALGVLHESGYELAKAIERLTPMATGAAANVYLRDQMEEWSIPEANLFEQALEQYSKDFLEIRRDFVRPCFFFFSSLLFLFSFFTC